MKPVNLTHLHQILISFNQLFYNVDCHVWDLEGLVGLPLELAKRDSQAPAAFTQL